MKRLVIAAAVSLAATTSLYAQVPVQVAVPAGIQQNPSGFYDLNCEVWFGDRLNGIVHYAPVDRTNPNPLTGAYQIDLTPGWTIEGIPGNPFAQFNQMGQLSRISDTLALLAVPDTGKNAAGKSVGGVYTVPFQPQFTFPVSPIGTPVQLVPDKGLNGPQPTSVAFGPDGKIYFGNLKNGNLQRINGTAVEAVGGTAGQAILSQAFNGSDDYLGVSDGFYVVPNAPACFGNANNCGKPVLIRGGATVAVASDGVGHVYFAQSTGIVLRVTVATGAISQVASGLSFGSITAGLGFDREGNLWIGELSQIDRILAADLAILP